MRSIARQKITWPLFRLPPAAAVTSSLVTTSATADVIFLVGDFVPTIGSPVSSRG